MSDTAYLFGLLLATGATTILLRAFPFLLFGSGRKPPAAIDEVGRLISPGAIAMLVVYCICARFDGFTFAQKAFGAAEAIASLAVIALQIKFKNPLLSILVGTVIYMVLIQKVFC